MKSADGAGSACSHPFSWAEQKSSLIEREISDYIDLFFPFLHLPLNFSDVRKHTYLGTTGMGLGGSIYLPNPSAFPPGFGCTVYCTVLCSAIILPPAVVAAAAVRDYLSR